MLLAYCILNQSAPLPASGMRGAALRILEQDGLFAVVSDLSGEGAPAAGLDDARSFNRALQEMFAHADLLPFRFPTAMATEDEMREHLAKHQAEYSQALLRLAGTAQFQLKISAGEPQAHATGADYMHARLAETRAIAQAAEAARHAAANWLLDWRERPSMTTGEQRQQVRRCYALIQRADAETLKSALAAAALHPDAKVVLSGPWPPGEFFRPGRPQEAGA